MPWSFPDNVPDVAKNWTDEEKKKCVEAANAVLEETDDEEQAIFACIHAAGKSKKGDRAMERKSFPSFILKVDDAQGIVEKIYAVYGNVDLGRDRILPGAFAKSIHERGLKVPILDMHQTDSIMRVIGRPTSIKEIKHDELPSEVQHKYPDATGGLWARIQYLMNTPEGKGAFLRNASGAVTEGSIGYDPLDVDYSDEKIDGEKVTIRNLRTCRLWELSDVIWGMNPATQVVSAKEVDHEFKGAIPAHTTDKAPEDEPWTRPTLKDFTDKSWDDLSDSEKRKIANHFAYSANMPPETYGDLSLPHHRPSDGAVVWRGLANCTARLNQVQGIGDAMDGVKTHLARHYKQFDKPIPWEAKAFKYDDFSTIYAEQTEMRDLWETHWNMADAFNRSLDSILSDYVLDGAAKLKMINESCKQYMQALNSWSSRVIAIGGKEAGEPEDVKSRRGLSTTAADSVRVAVAALNRLLSDSDGDSTDDIIRLPETSGAVTEKVAPHSDDPAEGAGPDTDTPTDNDESAGPDVEPPPSDDSEFAQLGKQLSEFETTWRKENDRGDSDSKDMARDAQREPSAL